MSLTDEMKKALDSEPPELLLGRAKYVKHFLYGEYGVGKTVLACQCVENRGLIIATDTGTDSLYNHPELLDKIEVVPYNGLSQLTAIAEAISEGYGKYKEFDAVIIDTISQVQEEYLDFLLDNYEFKGNLRDRAEPRSAKLRLRPEDVTGLPDYKLTRDKMRFPIKALIKAPVDVHFIAHLREPNFMEAQKGKLIRRPTLTEAVFKLIAREASLMGLMERTGTKRTVQFMTDKKTVSKSRISELDDKTIKAEELPEIIRKWKIS